MEDAGPAAMTAVVPLMTSVRIVVRLPVGDDEVEARSAAAPGYGTPEIVSSQFAGSPPKATFESLPFQATTLRSFEGSLSL